MLFYFCIVFLSQIVNGEFIGAQQEEYPFKIDFILILANNKFLNGTTTSITNPQTQNILFVQQHNETPNSLLLSLTKFHFNPSYSQPDLIYSFIPNNLSQTGFTILTSFITTSRYKSILLAYLTIKNGYGLQLVTYGLADSNTIFNGIYTIKYQWNTNISVNNTQNYLISPCINTIQLEYFTSIDQLIWSNSTISGNIVIQLKITDGYLSSLLFQLLIFRRSLYQSATLQNFNDYYFTIQIRDNVSNNQNNIVITNSHQKSTFYYFGYFYNGRLRNSWSYSIAQDYQMPQPNLLNTTFIVHKTTALGTFSHIYGYISDKEKAKATVIWIYAKNCKKPKFPYLLMLYQTCYDQCPRGFYNNSNNYCSYCSSCSNITLCSFCSISSCASKMYFYIPSKSCILCSTLDINCQRCIIGICDTCSSNSSTVLVNGQCVCNQLFYFDSVDKKCYSCFNQSVCETCLNSTYCLSCTFPFSLTIQNTCLDCVEGYSFVSSNNSCRINIIPFEFNVTMEYNKQINKITVSIEFKGDLTFVQENYQIQWKINQQLKIPNIETNTNILKAQFDIKLSFGIHILSVEFILISTSDWLLKHYQQLQIHVQKQIFGNMHQSQIRFYQGIQNIMKGASQNSGTILSSLSFSSLSGYIVGILWNFQITSYYLFLNVTKPIRLQMFLNTTIVMQDVQLIPFQIPHPFDENFKVQKDNNIYQVYDIDVYFLRSNFEDIFSLIIFSSFYYLLYFTFKKIKSKNIVFLFVKNYFVNKLYCNISMLIYSIVTVFAFTASASLINPSFKSSTHILNHFTSMIAMFLTFVFTTIHPLILWNHKQQENWQTQECYIGLNQQKKYSELVLLIFLLSQLVIPVTIPLFHPIFSILVILCFYFINLILVFKIRTIKLKISIYYRVFSFVCFIVFNLTYIILFILFNYFSTLLSSQQIQSIGWISVISILLVILLEAIQIITQIIVDIYNLIRKLRLKTRIRQLQFTKNIIQQTNIKTSHKIHKIHKIREGIYHKNNKQHITQQPFQINDSNCELVKIRDFNRIKSNFTTIRKPLQSKPSIGSKLEESNNKTGKKKRSLTEHKIKKSKKKMKTEYKIDSYYI